MSARNGVAVEAAFDSRVDRLDLEHIYRQHQPRLMGFFLRRVRDVDLARELTQETLVRFAGAMDRFDVNRPVWPYLKTIASNLIVDNHRDGRRHVVLDDPDVLVEEDGHGELQERIVLRAMLDDAKRDLPVRWQMALDLRYERGWSMGDSASFLGLTPGAFAQLLFRARSAMRESIEGHDRNRLSGLVLLPLALAGRIRQGVSKARTSLAGVGAQLGVELAVSLVALVSVGVAMTTVLAQRAAPESHAVSGQMLLSRDASPQQPKSWVQQRPERPDPGIAGERVDVGTDLEDGAAGVTVHVGSDGERFGLGTTLYQRTGIEVLQEGDVVSFGCDTFAVGQPACAVGRAAPDGDEPARGSGPTPSARNPATVQR